MEAIATQKYLIGSPRKLREVVFLIRKMSPADAVERLPFTHKRAAEPLAKVIKSAVANAKQKGASESELVFKEILINEGPRLKRFRAGSRGRAKPYKKRMSHIRVVVETKVQPKVEKARMKTKKSNAKTQMLNEETQVENKVIKKGAKRGTKS